MIRSVNVKRIVSIFFVIEILINIIAPTVASALTAGPTAPEATSFEPIDTTDIVDLKTGDLVYNIPMIEIPGPAGSYPLSLSYHAGILPNEEASWVGLGWTLNPGAISRLVNGYPDDHHGVDNVTRTFWEGGITDVWTKGGSIGIFDGASVSAGLSFGFDTYKGKGIGGYVGLQYMSDYGNGASAGGGMTMGLSPWGDPYGSANISGGYSTGYATGSAIALTGSTSLSMNSDGKLNAGHSSGVSAYGVSLMDVSISSSASNPTSVGVGGLVSSINNARQNQVSSYSSGWSIDIPLFYFNTHMGRDYTRYWIDETAAAKTYGSLYMTANPSSSAAFDTYDMPDLSLNGALFDDEEKVLGGSVPDHDLYNVAAQGIGGNIEPFHLQQHVYRQNKMSADNNFFKTKNYVLGTESNAAEFRFIGDFSNRFEYDPGDFAFNDNTLSYDFNENYVTGKNGNDGYNAETNHLAGSKHIEWFTNEEILSTNIDVDISQGGFLDCIAEGFQRDNGDQIGAFSITNASGVTYHFALPAYSYEEFMKSTRDDEDGLHFNTVAKPTKYAYAWFLTAVTGPDYVDRNDSGIADHGDWGYWVNFEYKKWLGDYKWRNPGIGANSDLDGEFYNYASGKKEVYYLDKIVTQTHVAIFEKSPRIDGREVTSLSEGGFDAELIYDPFCVIDCATQCGTDPTCITGCVDNCEVIGSRSAPRPSLRLDRIKLFNYDDFIGNHMDDEHLLRAIEFTYDYSLAKGTPNSYSENTPTTEEGKLTLKEVRMLGKGGASMIPKTTFHYDYNPIYGREMVDGWGYYKSDFSDTFRDNTNEVIGRQTTAASAQNVDAWSLTRIETPLGSTIELEYESDRYEDVVMAKKRILRTKAITPDDDNHTFKIEFWEDVDLTDFFNEGQEVEISLTGFFNRVSATSHSCDCGNSEGFGILVKPFQDNVLIDYVDGPQKYIIISNPTFFANLRTDTKVIRTYTGTTETLPDQCSNTVTTCDYTFSTHKWPNLVAGFVSLPEQPEYGGGIRVKSVKVNTVTGDDRVTEYQYENGLTSYEPFEVITPKLPTDFETNSPGELRNIIDTYQTALLEKFYKQIALSRRLPGPGVMYKNVTVREKNISLDNVAHQMPHFTKYEFELFQEGMIGVVSENFQKRNFTGTYETVNYQDAWHNKVTVKDFTSRIGALKSITVFDTESGTPVTKTTHKYLHDDLDGTFDDNVNEYETRLVDRLSNQGVIEQTFTRSRIASINKMQYDPYPEPNALPIFDKQQYPLLATITKIETFPTIKTGEETINYKTNISTQSDIKAFDFYSGEPTTTFDKDSYGNRFITTGKPAYERYPEMGLKIFNKNNKHMLTQSADTYSYLVGTENIPIGLMSASVQTWSDRTPVLGLTEAQTNIWRKSTAYQWNGEVPLNSNGSYDLDDFNSHQFNWSDLTQNDHWLKAGELTLYDVNSHGLEATDVNGNSSSTRFNRHQNKVIATTVNSKYTEMAYSGSEYYSANLEPDGGVSRGDGNPSRGHKHSGEFSLLVSTGGKGFNYTINSSSSDLEKKYRASVWVYAPGDSETQPGLDNIQLYYSVDGVEIASTHPILQKNKSKSWYLLSLDVDPGSGSQVQVAVRNNSGRGVYFDDFRVHPLNGTMTSFVYDQFSGELTYILDANNFYTHFEYDGMGRLIRTSKEMLNYDFGNGKESYKPDHILNETKYNYGKN